MAAVTVVSLSRPRVVGDLRYQAATVTVASSGDTWVVPGMKKIESFELNPDTARSCGATISGTTITFLTTAGNVAVGVFGI